MGRKVNPIGFRLKITRDWDARWFATGTQYKELLHEDFKIRAYIKKEAEKAGVSRIEIERNSNQLSITIHTARPGILIGRKGDAVKKLKQGLQDMTGKAAKVEVTEIEKPDLDAYLVGANIAQQIERRVGHSRAIKRAIQQAMRQGALGIKIELSGRLAGSDMARREWQSEGRVPRGTLRSDIDFAKVEATTTYGRIGVKVWVYKGDVLKRELPKKPSGEATQDAYVSP
ncbi:MAG: 30S ribosomal protein S3 [Chloroflexota bacterium]|nr:30S ribosomal protein S3 [Chloroflexota bacterium]